MPFVSAAQRGYLNAHPEVLGKKSLHEWNEASKGQHDLPQHVHKDSPYHMAREVRKEND